MIPHGADDDPLIQHGCSSYSAFPSLNFSNRGDALDFELEQFRAKGPVLVYVATHSDDWGIGGAIRHMSSAYALDQRGQHFCELNPDSFGRSYVVRVLCPHPNMDDSPIKA